MTTALKEPGRSVRRRLRGPPEAVRPERPAQTTTGRDGASPIRLLSGWHGRTGGLRQGMDPTRWRSDARMVRAGRRRCRAGLRRSRHARLRSLSDHRRQEPSVLCGHTISARMNLGRHVRRYLGADTFEDRPVLVRDKRGVTDHVMARSVRRTFCMAFAGARSRRSSRLSIATLRIRSTANTASSMGTRHG